MDTFAHQYLLFYHKSPHSRQQPSKPSSSYAPSTHPPPRRLHQPVRQVVRLPAIPPAEPRRCAVICREDSRMALYVMRTA
eukprot:scaffold5184_cov121-Isochrysis_galbana.AAC.6